MVVHAINFAGYSHNLPGYFHRRIDLRSRGSRAALAWYRTVCARRLHVAQEREKIQLAERSQVACNFHGRPLDKDGKRATETPVLLQRLAHNRQRGD